MTGVTNRAEKDLSLWTPRQAPTKSVLVGTYTWLEPFDLQRHGAALFSAYAEDRSGSLWTYLPRGPYARLDDYLEVARNHYLGDDPQVYVIMDPRDEGPLGQLAFMNVDTAQGCIELGGLIFSPRLQRSRMATEAVYLLLRRAFDDLGYRRCAWQTNALNGASRRAAERFGFRLEGIFRQAAVVKQQNRDTAWYAMLDCEWPAQRQQFERWLQPDNFDAAGRQKNRLSAQD